MFHFIETEIQRTYKFHFERPVIATHPNFKDQELAFTDASITLTAVWDSRLQSWRAKRDPNGGAPTITLDAPHAKRVRNGRVTKLDAFHNGGKLTPSPICLDSIQKRSWDDDLQNELRTAVVSAFWDEILKR